VICNRVHLPRSVVLKLLHCKERMDRDPYEGYQTHFVFDYFDLELEAFSRPANNPYSDYYDSGWRNHHNFS